MVFRDIIKFYNLKVENMFEPKFVLMHVINKKFTNFKSFCSFNHQHEYAFQF
jgi:hypothetical protein